MLQGAPGECEPSGQLALKAMAMIGLHSGVVENRVGSVIEV